MKTKRAQTAQTTRFGYVSQGTFAGQSFPVLQEYEGGVLLKTPAGQHDYPAYNVATAPGVMEAETVEIPVLPAIAAQEPTQTLIHPVIGRVREGYRDVVAGHSRALRSLTVALRGGKRLPRKVSRKREA